MLPYLYSAVRESTVTGMPVMRALWLHYPDDPAAVARGDQYLWGRDMLVAPVVEHGATARTGLPAARRLVRFLDRRAPGRADREITRTVDLETMPLYVRAGAILPLGPVKQYTAEKVDSPARYFDLSRRRRLASCCMKTTAASFNYRKGEWMGIQMAWNDRAASLTLRLAPGSDAAPARRDIRVTMRGAAKSAVFDGHPLEVRF